MKKNTCEILKSLGIAFLGLGVLLISLIALLLYYKPTHYEDSVSAYCENGFIVIKTNEDVTDLKIVFNNSLICKFDFIKRKTSKICNVEKFVQENKTTAFILSYNTHNEKVVFCYNYFSWIRPL